MGLRGCHPNDVWAEVREWLKQHQVAVPESLLDYAALCEGDGSTG
jgi:hypothetical protein